MASDSKMLRALEDGVEFLIANQKMHFHAVSSKDLKTVTEERKFTSSRKNSLRSEVMKSRSKSPSVPFHHEKSFFSTPDPQGHTSMDSEIAVSVAGTNMSLSKTGILKNYSGNSFLIQPLEFSQVFIVADLEHKTIKE